MKLNKIIFMGTPNFAVPSLQKISQSKYKPKLVITQPDRPKGRNKKILTTPIKKIAQNLNIPFLQPENINEPFILEEIRKIEPDIIITVAYGEFLKREFRKIPKFGCINLHPSLLPKYRGAAPINYTLFNGDEMTGNTIFKIGAKMDAGPIIFQSKHKINKEDNYTILQKKLAEKGAEDILKTLQMIENDKYELIQQNNSKASYTKKIRKEDLKIRWNSLANDIHNQVRGLAEKPAAKSVFRGKQVKIIKTELTEILSDQIPGAIVKVIKNKGIEIATADKNLILKQLQPAGKKTMNAYAFCLGAQPKPGEKFGNGS